MKILVVDDHPLFLDGLLQVLNQLDPHVVAIPAASAEQALVMLAAASDFDLILVDLNMPEMDGMDLLATLVERELWIPAVIISAHDNIPIIMQALDAGALGFIPKSFSAAELLAALKTILKGDVFLPVTIAEQIKQLRRSMAGTRPTIDIAKEHSITPRQFRVLELLAKGYSNKKIALTLNLTEHTVKSHLKALFATLGADNRTACVQRAEQLGLLKMSDVGARDN